MPEATLTERELHTLIGAFGKVCTSFKRLVLVVEVVVWAAVAVAGYHVLTHPVVGLLLFHLQDLALQGAFVLLVVSVCLMIQKDIDSLNKNSKELTRVRKLTKRHIIPGAGVSRVIRNSIMNLREKDRSEAASAVQSDVVSSSSFGMASPAPSQTLLPEESEVFSAWVNTLESDVWEAFPFTDPDNQRAQMFNDATSSIPFVCVKSTFECSAKKVIDFLTSTTPEAYLVKQSFDPSIAELRCIDSGVEGTSVSYTHLSLPWPLWARDCVCKLELHSPTDDLTYISISDVCKPPVFLVNKYCFRLNIRLFRRRVVLCGPHHERFIAFRK